MSLLWRAIIALMIGYSAFIAEVFRAGIQAVDKGQIEAAKALGLKRGQRFRLIILPQAIRTILPPLGNDFIAMVKDSSLVSVLGVADITQMGKIYAAGSFRFFETYSIVAYIYLILTSACRWRCGHWKSGCAASIANSRRRGSNVDPQHRPRLTPPCSGQHGETGDHHQAKCGRRPATFAVSPKN